MKKMTTVILLDKDEITIHATGEEPIEDIMDYALLERNRHVYLFKNKVPGKNAYYFIEVNPPLVITAW